MFSQNEADRLERVFAMPTHTVVRIQLRYLAADSWDGAEHAYIHVDGKTVWQTNAITPSSHCRGGFATMNAYKLYNPWAGWNRGYNDRCFFDVDFTLLHRSPSLTLTIGSTITGSRGDETWGFDNVIVSYHAAPTTFASKPSINFNYAEGPVSTVISYVDNNELSFNGNIVGTMDKLGGGFGITTKSGENAGQVLSTVSPAVTITESGKFWKTADGGAMSYVVPLPEGDKVTIEAMCAEKDEHSKTTSGDVAASGNIDNIWKAPASYGYDFFDYDNFDDPTGEGRYDNWHHRQGPGGLASFFFFFHYFFNSFCRLGILIFTSGGTHLFFFFPLIFFPFLFNSMIFLPRCCCAIILSPLLSSPLLSSSLLSSPLSLSLSPFSSRRWQPCHQV